MAVFTADHRRTGQTLGIIDGKAYGATNVYVIRSGNKHPRHFDHVNEARPTYRDLEPADAKPPPPPPPRKPLSSSDTTPSWIDYRQLKRRKRIAKYKLYAYEGKVKNSFKKGIRWIKRTCRKIVHGY